MTLGNAIRRILLSSLQGAAVTAIQIDGVVHEFSSLEGVREDVVDIVLNIKQLALRMHAEGPKRMTLRATGPGAVTAVGAKHLARKTSKTLGHIGARGTAYWNVRLLDRLFDFETIRVHSLRPESRNSFAERLSHDLGKEVVATADWQSCVEGADIVVEASRLNAPAPMLKSEWITPGALVVPYGTMSAVELSLTDMMTKVVVDDWGQCEGGKFGALRAHVEAGKLSRESLHAELGQIVAGLRPGREDDDETILFWHRGLSLSDIALGHAILTKAAAIGAGHRLRYA